jgi:hypothetical protein
VGDPVKGRLNEPSGLNLRRNSHSPTKTLTNSTTPREVRGHHGHLPRANHTPVHIRQVELVEALQIGFQGLAVMSYKEDEG